LQTSERIAAKRRQHHKRHDAPALCIRHQQLRQGVARHAAYAVGRAQHEQ
jgi:hypothetical protein